MPPDRRPNLLYIHSDQHNPYVTGCYGDELARTPNLDALAAKGVVLENVYCPSPICVPSRMSTLTGRHPFENRVWTNSHILSSSIPTMAHSMGAEGYHPVLIGRMHAIGPDQLLGYAERLVGDHGPNHLGGVGADHGALTGTAGPNRVSLIKSGHGQSAYQVHDEDVTAATIDRLNRLGIRKRAGFNVEPFSLTVGFMLPHQPFVARRDDYEYYYRRISPPKIRASDIPNPHPHIRWWQKACEIESVTPEEVRRARAAYWALVERMDAMIGDILASLRMNDLESNTLIVYSSDHGEQVGERGLWWKQTFYENSVKVPAIVSCPGRVREGLRIRRVASSLDINAFILDALGCPPLPQSRGRSFKTLLSDPETKAWDDVAFSEFCLDSSGAGGPFPETGVIQRMIRRGPWKLNYYHGQPSQLYNLEYDPDELEDRIDDPECADIRETLEIELLNDWDPESVSVEMSHLRRDQAILAGWGSNVKPADRFRWNLRPEMDFLDPEQMEG